MYIYVSIYDCTVFCKKGLWFLGRIDPMQGSPLAKNLGYLPFVNFLPVDQSTSPIMGDKGKSSGTAKGAKNFVEELLGRLNLHEEEEEGFVWE
jgi:hypothetical protein